MGQGLFEIILLAVVAAIIFRQLFMALGKKSGNEPGPGPVVPTRRPGQQDLERQADRAVTQAREPVPLDAPQNQAFFDTGDAGLVTSLGDIQEVDRNFDPKGFLEGAKVAYEIIVVAFAKGDKRQLKPLLSKEVYKSFEAEIEARAERGETVETTFVGVKSSRIVDAALNGKLIEVTVKFVGELISVTKNSEGAVIDGDPTTVYDVTDVWTFSRDSRSSDPNWQLIGTATS